MRRSDFPAELTASAWSGSGRIRRARSRAGPWWCLCLAVVLCLLLPGCSQQAEHSDGVQLVFSTQDLGPGTTFELRFDEPMARSSQIGIESASSPLLFRPAVAGHFVYTSSRSGIFTPEEPLTLGTEYELSLRPGLKRADGQPTRAQLVRRIQTPPFGIVNFSGPQSSTNAYSEPQFQLWFNAEVRASDYNLAGGFSSADGFWVAAIVHQGTREDTGMSWGPYFRTWDDAFHEQQQLAQALRRSHRKTPLPAEATNEIGNLLVLTPAQPLSVGKSWKLVIARRLTSADGRLSCDKAFEAQVGDVRPFTLEENSVHHIINKRPRLQLDFSKKLSLTLTNDFTNWVQIVPWPAELKAEVFGSTLSLVGQWQRRTNYSVTLRQGFPAAENFGLQAAKTLTVEVPPVDARLYFPAFSTEQYASGKRTFPLLAVNVDQIRLRAKLLDEAAAIHALRGYASYFPNQPKPAGQDGFQRLDYALLPGRTVFAEVVSGPKQEDVAQEIALDWDRILDGRQTGVIFLDAARAAVDSPNQPALGAQALIQLTDLGLVWKSGSPQLRVFVFSYQSGQAVPGVRVQVCSEENETLGEATTDSSGLASLNTYTNAAWLVARAAGDLHAVRVRDHNIAPYSFGIPIRWEGSPEDEAQRVALFTDRDVYRPGEVLNWKAVVRDLAEAGLRIPAGITGSVTCADARGKQFYQTNVILSDLGSCAASFPLPSTPRGEYQMVLTLDGHEHSHGFKVADYQPAAFEILINPKPAYAPGETVRFPVNARYFLGRGLERAQVRWSLEAEDVAPTPKGFDKFTFVRTPVEAQWGRGAASFTASGEGQITGTSDCVIQADVPRNQVAPQPKAVSVLVEVTDLNQQTLTRSASFRQHSSAFYLGLKRFEEVLETGKELPIEVAAVGADDTPWREPVQARLTLQRIEWHTVRVQGAGRIPRYRSEVTLTKVLEKDVTIAPPEKRPDVEGGFKGSHVEGVVTPAAGEYLLEVRSHDASGREVASSVSFYVTAKAQLAWNYRNEIEVKLVPDKPLYRPGDTALILVKTPISGTAWVTVECNQVLRSFTTQLEGNAPAVRVPIRAGDMPNVFVSVTLLRGGAESRRKSQEPEYRVGYCQLQVEDPATMLQVQVRPDAKDYLPGAIVTAETLVTDASGKPVPAAELTLYAVDEGVLSLTDYALPDLHQVFFLPRRLAVNSGISLPFLLPEDRELLTFQNKGYLGGGGGRERVRQRFLACAYWNANLRTGPDGHVTARFTAPDSLTRYQLMAVAHASTSLFGSGRSTFTISKPLIIEPALPRLGRIADRVQARALVLNQTDQAGDVLVNLQLDDKASSAEPSRLAQKVHVRPRGSAVAEFPLTFVDTGTASWTWRARFAEASLPSYADAVRSTLQVGTVLPLLREVRLIGAGPSDTNLLARVNPQVLTGHGAVNIMVAGSRVVGLGEAVAQLLHYPYGCAEQTGSSLLPWVLLEHTPELIPFAGRDTNETAMASRAGIQRLLSMQTQSGGVGYWPGAPEPMFWASAYGAVVLASARKAGLPVPEDSFRRLTDYLSARLREPSKAANDLGERCLALYALALAGRAEPAYHTYFYERRGILAPEDRALLALAIAAGTSSNKTMTDELLKTEMAAAVPASPFTCPARQSAIRLLALLACQPNSPEVVNIAGQLQHGRWEWTTTQGNAWALLAMHQFLRRTETGVPDAGGTLTWGDQAVPFHLTGTNRVFAQSFRLNPAKPDQPLVLHASSALFAQVTVEARSFKTNQVQEDHGIRIQRQYQRLDENNELQPLGTPRVGDRILVTLHVAVPEPASYVAVEDALPSLFEAVNTEFKTQQLTPGRVPAWMTPDDSNSWWSDFREIRTDRVLFFANYLERGSYAIRYVARVRAAGTVTAPPAKAEEMYRPDRFGLTETQALTCRASE